MKKLFAIIVLGLLWNNSAFSENPNNYIKTTWSYERIIDRLNIEAYNSHMSKTIIITKIDIWNSTCPTTGTPDRSFNLNSKIKPISRRDLYYKISLPEGTWKCARISKKFETPQITNQFKQPKKTNDKKKKSNFKGFSFFDPTSCGTVYDDTFGNKIASICFKYNERKQRGSYDRAISNCLSYLRARGPHVEGCL